LICIVKIPLKPASSTPDVPQWSGARTEHFHDSKASLATHEKNFCSWRSGQKTRTSLLNPLGLLPDLPRPDITNFLDNFAESNRATARARSSEVGSHQARACADRAGTRNVGSSIGNPGFGARNLGGLLDSTVAVSASYFVGGVMSFIVRLLGQFRSLRRFPVPVAISLLLTILVNLQIVLLSQLGPLEAEAIYGLLGAFFAALIVDLVAEGRGFREIAKLTSSIGAGAAIAVLQLLHGKLYDQSVVVIGALALGLMTAAHLRSEASNESLWNFDLRLGIAAAMGLLAFLITCGGVSLLLVSIQYLFDLNMPARL
jgi:hypothetical protein